MQEASCRYASVRAAYELKPALSPDTNVPFIIGRTNGAFGWTRDLRIGCDKRQEGETIGRDGEPVQGYGS